MSVNPLDLMRREPVLALLLALSAGCAIVALVLSRNAVTALIGGLLVVVYWFIELLAARVGREGSFGRGMAVGLGGMAVITAWWGIWHIVAGLSVATYWSKREPRAAT